ncbi:hypothetical protein BKA62DRAFT_229704 [Auriculariales sp. MPI-PUGE-AT-0066]|nr:hypothetical protein BKA62DRAFT_229704 [Auriculariales sp. MPI-PUGE-AT-0066]
MWCNNCLLIFPLRGGAIAWNLLIATYSFAGGIFLLRDGNNLFFVYPEWSIYGGIGMGVSAIAPINVFALTNRSYVWTRVCGFLWPLLIVICALRAIVMIVQFGRNRDKVVWECMNGGQHWGDEPSAKNATTTASFPDAICASGFDSLNWAFIFALAIDVGCQMYAWFLNWRHTKWLESYKIVSAIDPSSIL